MTLLFNGDPQGPVGDYTGSASWYDPPFHNTYVGSQGTYTATSPRFFANNRARIKQDANGRFGSGVKYWEFETQPGDSFPNEAGEKTRLSRPWQASPEWPFEGTDRELNAPTGPWGQIRYYGFSFKIPTGFVTPKQFCNFFEIKMTHTVPNGIYVGPNQGWVVAEGDSQIRLFATIMRGPYNDAGVLPGWKYGFDIPPIITSVTKAVWYDVIVGVKFKKDDTGWMTTWHKLGTNPTWTETNVIVNDFTAPWYQPTGELNEAFGTQGIYRGISTTGATHVVAMQGFYMADTFNDIANGIYGIPAVSTSATGPWATLKMNI